MTRQEAFSSCQNVPRAFVFVHIRVSRTELTCILRLDGNDALPLGTKALGSPGLDLELVGHILDQVWDGQTRLCTVTIHLEGLHVSLKRSKNKKVKESALQAQLISTIKLQKELLHL